LRETKQRWIRVTSFRHSSKLVQVEQTDDDDDDDDDREQTRAGLQIESYY